MQSVSTGSGHQPRLVGQEPNRWGGEGEFQSVDPLPHTSPLNVRFLKCYGKWNICSSIFHNIFKTIEM